MAELVKVLVAAIDFGTTYSGYAFSLSSDYATNQTMKIYCNHWNAGARGLVSYKTPTTLLIDSKKQFHSFGYEAEDKFADLAEDDAHIGWYYFRRFKMKLFKNAALNRKTEILDIVGKPMLALKIIEMSIRYIKGQLLKTLHTQGLNIEEHEIHWVLTVPAIWDDSAKQFMREAAQEAGIDGSSLTIALEPEAASLFCQHLPVEKLGAGEGIRPFTPGNRYLVLDAGGGTVDITVHEVQECGSLKELHKASGGDWGGTQVDEEYKTMLTSFMQQDTMEEFRKNNTSEFLDLYREFETKKRSINQDNVYKKVTIKVPIALKEVFEDKYPDTDINEAIRNCPNGRKLEWKRDKIHMGPSAFAELFGPVCDKIVEHVQKLLKKPTVKGTNTIIMVGGFSESFVLQTKIRESFPHIRTIIPEEAGLAVLKGAVLYGHNPNTIQSRIAKKTYGVRVVTNFDSDIHDINKRECICGVMKCTDIFSRHIEKGQVLKVNEAQAERTYNPTSDDQTSMQLSVYTSSALDPMYVTDQGCSYEGSLTIDMPDTTGGKKREVKVWMIFGGTELEVKATDVKSGNWKSAKFDFLQ